MSLTENLTLREVAHEANITVSTARTALRDARRKRREGASTSRDLPEPTGMSNGASTWSREVVDAWLDARGRPLHTGIPRNIMHSIHLAAMNGDIDRVIKITEEHI